MRVLNKKRIKDEFSKVGMKIGKDALSFLEKHEEKRIRQDIEKISRNARLLGRKVIRKEDIEA